MFAIVAGGVRRCGGLVMLMRLVSATFTFMNHLRWVWAITRGYVAASTFGSRRAHAARENSRSRKKRIDQISRIFNARWAPTCLPAIQAGHPAAPRSYSEIAMIDLLGRRSAEGSNGASPHQAQLNRGAASDPIAATSASLPEGPLPGAWRQGEAVGRGCAKKSQVRD